MVYDERNDVKLSEKNGKAVITLHTFVESFSMYESKEKVFLFTDWKGNNDVVIAK